MKIDCPACGSANPAPARVCYCGVRLQSAESAQEKQRQWDRMPPAQRVDFEKLFAVEEERWGEYRRSLRRWLPLHLLLGGALAGGAGLATVGLTGAWGFAAGAAAALLLNLARGGKGLGALAFGAAYGAVAMAHWGPRAFLLEEAGQATSVFYCYATLALLMIIGAYFGLRLDGRRYHQMFYGAK